MQKNKQAASKTARVNFIVIGSLVILAVGLIIAWRAGLFQSSYADMNRDEINSMMQADSETANESVPEPEAYLFIILNNRVWGIEPLGEERDVTVDQGNGVVNVIHLLPDGFYMLSSTCDNQLCVTEGTVNTQNYQMRFLGPCVYCLPHNLQLELVVPGAKPDPNAPDI